MRRVVVTGLGAVSPLGVGVKRTWDNLLHGRSGIVSTDGLGDAFSKLPSRVAGLVPRACKHHGGWDSNDWLRRGDDRQMPLFTQYALAAAQEAVDDAGCEPTSDEDREAIGVSLGSGIGSLNDAYATSLSFSTRGHHAVSPLFVPRLLINLAAGHLALRHDLRGPNLAPTTACTTGAHALAAAYLRLAHPASPTHTFIAGAAESCIHPLAISGFARARSLATSFNSQPGGASRPFDTSRDGFVIAEGAAVLVLETLEHALDRKAHIHAELAGVGESCDAHHVTSPALDGRGAAAAMRDALRMAEVAPRDVGYVNAHATGTAAGDGIENRAVRDVLLGRGKWVGLGEVWRRGADINMSSVKGAMGHLLGAAGAVEAVATVLAVEEGILPPTLNLETPGNTGGSQDNKDEWDCNYVAGTAQARDVSVALSNSFGFGGTNASLCFKRFED